MVLKVNDIQVFLNKNNLIINEPFGKKLTRPQTDAIARYFFEEGFIDKEQEIRVEIYKQVSKY